MVDTTYIKEQIKCSSYTQKEISRKMKISPASLNMMISGKAALPYKRFKQLASILNLSIDKIAEIEKMYIELPLRPGALDWNDTIKEDNQPIESNAKIVKDFGIFKPVPLISCAAAKGKDCHLQATTDNLGSTDEYVSFPNAKETDKAIQICGDSMSPWYPDGTYVLVSTTQWPLTGDRVVVITEDGDILFKVFVDEGDEVRLMSINRNNGKDMLVSKRSEIKVYPIKMSLRDEHKLDEEMKEAGKKHFWEK